MAKVIRRTLLALCAVLLLAAAVTAIQPQNERQLAVVETARAFVDKKPYVQYDSTQMTIQDKNPSGVSRLTSGMPVDYASADNILYSVCSDFCYDVYNYAFHYDLMGSPRESRTKVMTSLPATDPIIAYKYDSTGADSEAETDLQKALTESRALLQPGDIIVGYGKSGHAMLFVGDYKNDGKDYIIHCWGSKINMSTGVDAVEAGGAISIVSVDDACYKVGGLWDLSNPGHGATFCIMRPLNDIEANPKQYPITEAAQTRLQHSRLWVDRTTDKWRYNSVRQGDILTVTVTVANYSKSAAAEGIVVTENLPSGTMLLGAPNNGGTVSGTQIRWTVNLASKVSTAPSVKLQYQLLVTAPAGSTLTLPGGKVDGLSTRPITYRVGEDALSYEQQAALTAVANGTKLLSLTDTQGAFANSFYREVLGMELNLPETIADFQSRFFNLISVRDVPAGYGGKMWQPKPRAALAEADRTIYDMLIPEHTAGFGVYLGSDPNAVPFTMNADGRVLIFNEAAYEPGDIFIAMCDPDVLYSTSEKNTETFIYLGNGKVAAAGTDGMKIVSFDQSIKLMLRDNLLLGLRPTQTLKAYAEPYSVTAPIGSVSAAMDNGTAVITVAPNLASDGYVIAAWYQNGALAGTQMQSAAKAITFRIANSFDSIRLYRLDDHLAPMCAVSTLSIKSASLPAVGTVPRYADSIRLNNTTVTLGVGGSAQLSAVLTPSNAERKDVRWFSSNPSVATVSENGLVKCVAKGSATVTAVYCGRLMSTCKIETKNENETPRIPIH